MSIWWLEWIIDWGQEELDSEYGFGVEIEIERVDVDGYLWLACWHSWWWWGMIGGGIGVGVVMFVEGICIGKSEGWRLVFRWTGDMN